MKIPPFFRQFGADATAILPEEARAEIRLLAALDVRKRTIPGAAVYIAIALVLLFATEIGARDRALFAGLLLAYIVLGAVRIHFAVSSRQALQPTSIARFAGAACFLLSGALWGLLAVYALCAYGMTIDFYIIITCGGGLCSGSLLVQSPHLYRNLLYMGSILLPASVLCFFHQPPQGPAMGLVFLTYLVVTGIEASIVYNQYWGSRVNAKLLEIRARELEEEKLRAETFTRAKSQFLANISHEIRTPITGIIGMAEIALDMAPQPEQRRCLETILSSTESLLVVVNDILDYSKIEAGKLTLEPVPFEVRTIAGAILKPAAAKASEKKVDLACYISPRVPEVLRGDPFRLRQALVNIVGNAVKFTESGEVVFRMDVVNDEDGKQMLHTVVSDTGIGIPPEAAAYIFEPFSQSDSSMSRRFGGTGLGLSITQTLLELMGGSSEVVSPTEVLTPRPAAPGTDFHIRVPLDPVVQEDAVPEIPTPFSGKHILLAEKNCVNRAYFRTLLENAGAQVDEVAEAGTILSLGDSLQNYELFLIDAELQFAADNPLSTWIAFSAPPPCAPIVMTVQAGNRIHMANCLEQGVSASIIKPFTPDELLEAVETALRKSRHATDPAVPFSGSISRKIRPLKVLLAEDNEINIATVSMMLRQAGHLVEVVTGGEEAVEKALSGKFDIVLMDVQMPVMDGLTATRIIRESERRLRIRRVPIVALTAHAMRSDETQCLSAGMDAFLSKPLHARQLHAILEKFFLDAKNQEETRPDTEAEAPVSIRQVLENLGDSRSLLNSLISRFLVQIPPRLAPLKTALLEHRFEEVYFEVHKIKGVAGYFSARIIRLGNDLEVSAREKDNSVLTSLVPAFIAEVETILNYLSSDKWQRVLDDAV